MRVTCRQARQGQEYRQGRANLAFDPIFPAGRLEALTAAGFWGDDSIIDHLDRVALERPEAIAVVDHNSKPGSVMR